MRRLIPVMVVVAALGWLGSNRVTLAGAGEGRYDLSARAEAKSKSPRARVRVRVTPRCPYRTETLDHPPAADCDFPGPGFVRQCVARLVQEDRPSGTVVVPRMWCWWERG